MTAAFYRKLRGYLDAPPRRVIGDWPAFVHPHAPPPDVLWQMPQRMEHVNAFADALSWSGKFLLLLTIAEIFLPAWEETALANGTILSASATLPRRALNAASEWAAGTGSLAAMFEVARDVRRVADFRAPAQIADGGANIAGGVLGDLGHPTRMFGFRNWNDAMVLAVARRLNLSREGLLARAAARFCCRMAVNDPYYIAIEPTITEADLRAIPPGDRLDWLGLFRDEFGVLIDPVGVMEPMLADPDFHTRVAAMRACVVYGGPEFLPIAATFLDDCELLFARHIISALGESNLPGAVPLLLAKLRATADWYLQLPIARALEKLGPLANAAVPELVRLAGSVATFAEVRQAAREAIAAITGES